MISRWSRAQGWPWPTPAHTSLLRSPLPALPTTAFRASSVPLPVGAIFLIAVLAVLLLLPSAPRAADADEYSYIARPGDTLIGLSRRLLREPKRWNEVQQRNHITNPYRIPPGSAIRIPYSWLKVTAESASVAKVAGAVTSTLGVPTQLATAGQSASPAQPGTRGQPVTPGQPATPGQSANSGQPVSPGQPGPLGQSARSGQPVTAGQHLPQGSLVETGPDGSVAIDLADGSQIILLKSSSLRLSEMQHIDGVPNSHDIQLQLPQGHADTLVKPHRDVGRFEIVTPTAALAVRGTVFRTTTLESDGAVTTETLEGTVAVSASGQTVDTHADFGTRVEKGAAPLKPVPLLPAPELSAVPDTNGKHDWHLEFPPIAGAKSYHVQLSDDAEFRTFVADVRSDQPILDMPAPPDGAYWLRVRGIDSLALEGHDAVKSFTQQTLPEPPKPPPPTPQLISITRHDLHFQWTTEPGRQYRVQIARDSHFKHVLTEQTSSEGNLAWKRPWPGKYYIRVEVVPAAGTTEGTPFDVPVPLWVKITIPFVVLTPLLF